LSYCNSYDDIALAGLSVFDSSSWYGAICDQHVWATASCSNLTNLKGEWGSDAGRAAVIYQGGRASLNGSFLLFANCSRGYGCFCKSGGNATFWHCVFLDNSVGAIAHFFDASQDLVGSCYFVNTGLGGSLFDAGTVLVVSCLFAGEIPSNASFILTGIQVSFTSTEIKFDTASMLPTCGGVAKLPTSKEATKGTAEDGSRSTPKGGVS
jgi:hypothetical protein